MIPLVIRIVSYVSGPTACVPALGCSVKMEFICRDRIEFRLELRSADVVGLETYNALSVHDLHAQPP